MQKRGDGQHMSVTPKKRGGSSQLCISFSPPEMACLTPSGSHPKLPLPLLQKGTPTPLMAKPSFDYFAEMAWALIKKQCSSLYSLSPYRNPDGYEPLLSLLTHLSVFVGVNTSNFFTELCWEWNTITRSLWKAILDYSSWEPSASTHSPSLPFRHSLYSILLQKACKCYL